MTIRKFLKRLTKDRADRGPPVLQEILTTEQIGPRRSKTPEGFLLCEAVPIARIGIMVYGPGEVPIEVGKDGFAYVSRTADELFSAATIASFVGKPVVDEHPDGDVTPDNWAKLAKGVAFNIRPGSGEDADVLLADLLITDAKMIRDIDAMKREVSAGYEADYEQHAPGQGDQSEILGNHIALVEKGRCGPRCAIGDQSHLTSRKANMATQKQTGAPRRKISKATLDAVMEQLANAEENAATLDDGELSGPADSHTHIHIHGIGSTATQGAGAGAVDVKDDSGGASENPGNGTTADPNEARFAALENGHKEIIAQIAALTQALSGKGGSGGSDPTGDADKDKDDKDKTEDADNPFAKKDDKDKDDDKEKDKGKTSDSAALETSYKETLSGCEVLVPGFRVATFDAKAKRSTTIDAMCSARRKALDAFSATADGQQILESVSGVKTVDTAGLGCSEVAVLFRASVGAKKLLNNGAATKDAQHLATQQNDQGNKGVPTSLAELNALHRKHFAPKQH